MKYALDPTPFHSTHSLLEFPRVVKDLGYDYLQMTPHPDFIPFFRHPKADDELVAQLAKACRDADVVAWLLIWVPGNLLNNCLKG